MTLASSAATEEPDPDVPLMRSLARPERVTGEDRKKLAKLMADRYECGRRSPNSPRRSSVLKALSVRFACVGTSRSALPGTRTPLRRRLGARLGGGVRRCLAVLVRLDDVRGEEALRLTSFHAVRGTAPRARGRLLRQRRQDLHRGNSPACAGTRSPSAATSAPCPEQPRARGTRTTRTACAWRIGNSPACAGTTRRFYPEIDTRSGTAPRLRGCSGDDCCVDTDDCVVPAPAGLFLRIWVLVAGWPGRPRACGAVPLTQETGAVDTRVRGDSPLSKTCGWPTEEQPRRRRGRGFLTCDATAVGALIHSPSARRGVALVVCCDVRARSLGGYGAL